MIDSPPPIKLPSMTGDPQRFIALDGLRGIAALAVLLFHAGLALDCPWMVGHGAVAVDIFFAMSGFVVDRAYGSRLRAGWPPKAFVMARLRRLYPLYLIGTLLGLTLQIFWSTWRHQPNDIDGLILLSLFGAALTPLFRGGGRHLFPLDPPCWSLLVEAVMNAGLVLAPRWRPVHVATGMAAAAGVLMTAGLGCRPLLHGGSADSFWIDIARGLFGFGCGLLLSHAERLGRLTSLRGRWTSPMMLGMLGILLIPRGPADVWLDPLAISLFCPAIVALAIAHAQPSNRMRHLCIRAGALSYPLYILHAPLLNLAVQVAPPTGEHSPLTCAAAVGVALVLSVTLAAVAAHRLEPSLSRTSRWLGAVNHRVSAS